jgi:hypothetical protein
VPADGEAGLNEKWKFLHNEDSAMSGVIKSIKKKFKKMGPLGKLAMIAGMIWLGGVAVNAFSGPGMTLGNAVSATNASWSSALGMTEATAPLVTEGAASVAAPVVEGAATIAAPVAESAAAVNAGGIAGELTAMSANPLAAEAAVNSTVAGATAAAPASTSLFGGNGGLIAGMMGGNAIMGSMAAADVEEQRKQEEEVRRSRGLFGVNYEGANLNRPTGIVQSQQLAPQATVSQAVQTPGVQNSYVQPQAMPQVNRPVARQDLAALHQQGLVASQKQQRV